MLSSNVWASELARRMNTTPQEVSRLIDLTRTTKIDRIEEALAALGKRLELIAA
jgi:antitoxin HicB